MDCPKKFKRYCKYHNVEIEDDDLEFYRRHMRMESCLKQDTPEKTLF